MTGSLQIWPRFFFCCCLRIVSGCAAIFWPQHILYWKSCVLLPKPLLIFKDYAQDLQMSLIILSGWPWISLSAHLSTAKSLLLPHSVFARITLSVVKALGTLTAISQFSLSWATFCLLQLCFLLSSASSLTMGKWWVVILSLWWQESMPD